MLNIACVVFCKKKKETLIRNFLKKVSAWQATDNPPKDIIPDRVMQAMAVFLVVPTRSRQPRVISIMPLEIP